MKTGVNYSSLYPSVFVHDSNRAATHDYFHYLFILAHQNIFKLLLLSNQQSNKPKDSEVANGKQQIVTFKRLKPANV